MLLNKNAINLYSTKFKYETIISMSHGLVVVMSSTAVQGNLAFTLKIE